MSSHNPVIRRWLSACCAWGAVSFGWIPALDAGVFSIRPIEFVHDENFSIVATGTISTVGNTSVISDWNLTVTTAERLAHFTPANTGKSLSQVSVSADGQRITVATSPDPLNEDGGFLGFRSPRPIQDVGTVLADFTGPNASGGEAMYMFGPAFDFLRLNQPSASEYLAAQASSVGGDVYEVVPLSFDNGVRLSGTLKTDGAHGLISAGNIETWDIDVAQMTIETFDKSNSVLSASGIGLTTDGMTLTVDNPDGSLIFIKGFPGRHLYGLELANFTDQSPYGGQAGYFQGRLASYTVNLQARPGPWDVTGANSILAVPEPTGLALIGTALLTLLATGVRKMLACVSCTE